MRGVFRGGEGITLAVLLLVCLVLFVLPLGLLAKVALGDGLGPVWVALDSRSVPRALWNSIESALLSALLALGMGTFAALILGLTDTRRKGVFTFLLLIPMMIPPLMAAATLHYFYLGAMYAVATGVADSRTRATSVALTLFVVNLIGIGLGPTVIGFLSTYIKSAMLGGSDLGLTIAICKDAGNLAPDAAAACTGATAKALQWSIVIFATLYGWAALHYHWAGKTLQRDMITKAA